MVIAAGLSIQNATGGLLTRLLIMGAFGWKKGVRLWCQVGYSKYLQKGLLLNQNEMSVAQALHRLQFTFAWNFITDFYKNPGFSMVKGNILVLPLIPIIVRTL